MLKYQLLHLITHGKNCGKRSGGTLRIELVAKFKKVVTLQYQGTI
jgi:hypothetical protein